MARDDDRRHDRELEPLPPLDPMFAAPTAEVTPDLVSTAVSGVPLEGQRSEGGEAGPGGAARRWRHRSAVALVLVIALVAAGTLTQSALDRRAARRAAVAFDSFEGADYLLSQETLAVDNEMVPDDQPGVDTSLARAELQQAATYKRQVSSLRTAVWMDGATRHLVTAVRAALQARIADINAVVAWRAKPPATRGVQPADPSVASKAAVDHALVLAAAHVVRPPSNGPPQFFDTNLVLHLSNWTDAPTGSTLAVADASGVALVDVDASTAIDLNLTGTVSSVLARKGYVAAVTPVGAVLAKAPTLGSPVVMLGEAGEILPAVQPDAVWLVETGGDASDGTPVTTVTEVDGTSRRLVGAVLVPRGEYVTGGVTDEGLILSVGGARLAVWDPATGHSRLVTSEPAVLLAASDHLVAWQGDSQRTVNVTDVRTGGTTVVEMPGENFIVPEPDVSSSTCVFSPDDAQLACPILTLPPLQSLRPSAGDQSPYHLGVINPNIGTVTVLAGAAGRADAHPIVWSPDGSRLWSVVATPQGSLLATWSPGDVIARELRYHARNWMVGLVVVDQRSA